MRSSRRTTSLPTFSTLPTVIFWPLRSATTRAPSAALPLGTASQYERSCRAPVCFQTTFAGTGLRVNFAIQGRASLSSRFIQWPSPARMRTKCW